MWYASFSKNLSTNNKDGSRHRGISPGSHSWGYCPGTLLRSQVFATRLKIGDSQISHDDVIKWKHFPRNWPFVRGIHRSRWIPHTKASDVELWCLFFICVWINGLVNNREAGDLSRHRGLYDVNVMIYRCPIWFVLQWFDLNKDRLASTSNGRQSDMPYCCAVNTAIDALVKRFIFYSHYSWRYTSRNDIAWSSFLMGHRGELQILIMISDHAGNEYWSRFIMIDRTVSDILLNCRCYSEAYSVSAECMQNTIVLIWKGSLLEPISQTTSSQVTGMNSIIFSVWFHF